MGQALLQREVLHLPALHDQFQRYATELALASDLDKEGAVKSVSSTWLLSGLTANLQHHIAYSCKVRKYGTLIFRPNTDLFPSLQKAMWKVRHLEMATGDHHAESIPMEQESVTQHTHKRVMVELNELVHNEVRRIVDKTSKTPVQNDQLDIDSLIQEADPQLWEAICILTRTVSEKKGTTKRSDTSVAYQTKKLRRFFLLCMILFCSDDRCSVPLHILLTDVVDSQGGSALLVRILNRIGVCASQDTLLSSFKTMSSTVLAVVNMTISA